MKAAIVYLFIISGAEVVTNYTDIFVGITSHALILISLLIYSALKADSPRHKLFLALTLAPLTRVLSLSMPLTKFPVIYWYAIIYPVLMVGAWVTMRRLNYRPGEIGLNTRQPYLQLLIALSGIVLGITEYVILRPPPIVPELSLRWVLVSFLVLMGGTGLGEEFIFRGVAQKAAVEALGRWGILYIAFIFAVLHLVHRSPIDILFVFSYITMLLGCYRCSTLPIWQVSKPSLVNSFHFAKDFRFKILRRAGSPPQAD